MANIRHHDKRVCNYGAILLQVASVSMDLCTSSKTIQAPRRIGGGIEAAIFTVAQDCVGGMVGYQKG
jgi:hypothetical protein